MVEGRKTIEGQVSFPISLSSQGYGGGEEEEGGEHDGVLPGVITQDHAGSCAYGKAEYYKGILPEGLPLGLISCPHPFTQSLHSAFQIANAHGAGIGAAIDLFKGLYLHGAAK